MKKVSPIAFILVIVAMFATQSMQAQDFEAIGKGLMNQLAARQINDLAKWIKANAGAAH
jgi:hypothetical protein